MAEGLITIKAPHETEIIINKSRFIASIHPAETEEEAKAFIQQKKKEHHSATHNCSSYVIGPTMLTQKPMMTESLLNCWKQCSKY